MSNKMNKKNELGYGMLIGIFGVFSTVGLFLLDE